MLSTLTEAWLGAYLLGCSGMPCIAVINTTDKTTGSKGFVCLTPQHHSLSLKEIWEEIWGQELKQQPIKESCTLLCSLRLTQLAFLENQQHLPRASPAHSGLISATSIVGGENFLQPFPRAKLMEAFSQLRWPLLSLCHVDNILTSTSQVCDLLCAVLCGCIVVYCAVLCCIDLCGDVLCCCAMLCCAEWRHDFRH